jgi:hypothetical protein
MHYNHISVKDKVKGKFIKHHAINTYYEWRYSSTILYLSQLYARITVWRIFILIKHKAKFLQSIIAVGYFTTFSAVRIYAFSVAFQGEREGIRNEAFVTSLSIAVQPFGPWPLFQFLNATRSQ